MICIICRQADVVDGWTSVTFERGEMELVVNNVPARVCPVCSEAFVSELVALRLLRAAEEMSKAGDLGKILEYQRI